MTLRLPRRRPRLWRVAILLLAAVYFLGPLAASVRFSLVQANGKDGFGNQTATEILTQPRLVLDAGKLIMDKPNFLDFYVGFQYWYNKFGTNHEVGAVPVLGNGFGSTSVESTAYIGTTYHFK